MALGMTGADPPHFAVRPTCQVVSSPFTLADQTILSGRLLSMDLTATKDDSASRATLVFSRGTGSDSLSPHVAAGLRVGSRPALSPGNWVDIFLEINGFGVGKLWRGRIDRVNAAGTFGSKGIPSVTISCRDFGALFLNGVLRYDTNFNDTDGILDRIQNVANEAYVQGGIQGGTGGAIDIVSRIKEPVSTGWVMNPLLPQRAMSVMEAARRMVQTFGGDFRVVGRYGWENVCIIIPPRVTMQYEIHSGKWVPIGQISDATIGPDRYVDIQEVASGDEDVRNIWAGWYQDATTGLPVGPTERFDQDSINNYGPRPAQVYLDRAENVISGAQMTVFLDAALADNKDPLVSHRIGPMPIYPNVELDDVHTYLANGQEYDENMQLTVAAYTHHWDSEPGSMATTTIGARGVPIGAYREYRRSVPPKIIVTTMVPTTEYAPEGTVIMVTDSIAPP